jgi:hypothetical protein
VLAGSRVNSQLYLPSPRPPKALNQSVQSRPAATRNSKISSDCLLHRRSLHIQPKDMPAPSALKSHSSSPFLGCFRCLGKGHWARSCRSDIRCRFCYLYGHIEKSCFREKKKKIKPLLLEAQARHRSTNSLRSLESRFTSPPRA